MADFHYYLNRQGPKGEKGDTGEKGADGKTPTFYTGTNTDLIYTLIIDSGDGNTFETGNLKTPIDNRGGTYLRYDQMTGIQYTGPADSATTTDYGVVKLAPIDGSGDDDSVITQKQLTSEIEDINDAIQSVGNSIGNGTITIQQGGVVKGTFTTNQSGNQTINLDAGGGSAVIIPGDGIDVTGNTVSAKVDGVTITFDANGRLQTPGYDVISQALDAILGEEEE